jgi:hypothetical protein
MTSIQARAENSTPPGAADDFESPTPMAISATRTQAPFLQPRTSKEADLRVLELGADVDDLKQQSLEAEEAYMVARRRVRPRGAGVSSLDERDMQALESEAEVRASSISDLLNTRSDELSNDDEVAADLRLPTPCHARLESSPDNLPSPSIVGTAGVPPRLLLDTAADVSPSIARFSTPVPSSVSLVDGPTADPPSNPVEAETEPSRSPLPGPVDGTPGTLNSIDPDDALLPGPAEGTIKSDVAPLLGAAEGNDTNYMAADGGTCTADREPEGGDDGTARAAGRLPSTPPMSTTIPPGLFRWIMFRRHWHCQRHLRIIMWETACRLNRPGRRRRKQGRL